MIDNEYQPIIVTPMIFTDEGITFLLMSDELSYKFELIPRDTKTREIYVKADLKKLLIKILGSCNGLNSIRDISIISGISITNIKRLVCFFISNDIITDGRTQYLHFHKISNYPTCYQTKLSNEELRKLEISGHNQVNTGIKVPLIMSGETALSSLIFSRRSCRSFSDETITISQLSTILNNAYNITKHAVPSGGALYPLKIFVIQIKCHNELDAGYYEFAPDQNAIFNYAQIDTNQLLYIFNSEVMPYNSKTFIVIAADINRQPHKYSNRGYRLTLIEAGQVAQNITLTCQELGVASVEMGGVLDEPLSAELRFNNDTVPLLCVALGKKSDVKYEEMHLLLEKLEKLYVGPGAPIKKYGINFCKDAAFFSAYAQYGDIKDKNYSGATSFSDTHAMSKAIIEGYERYISGQLHYEILSSAAKLKTQWINPLIYVPFSSTQVEKNGLQKFDDTLAIEWIKGVRYDGTDVYVPVDLVFYPIDTKKLGRRLIYYANSSGVAAYTDRKNSEIRAILELFERDAIMRNWFSKKGSHKLSKCALPLYVIKRLKYWKNQDRTVTILDLSQFGICIIEVIIISEMYPYFVCGAASSLNSVESTIIKAFQEAEYNIIHYMNNEMTSIEPKDVNLPFDHGRLYATHNYLDDLKWLWSGDEVKSVSTPNAEINEIKKQFNIISVELSPPNSFLSVIRVFSEKLVPISFGFLNEHYLHRESEYIWKQSELPHYFA